MDYQQTLIFLTVHFCLPNEAATAYIVTLFQQYVDDFLADHPDALEPVFHTVDLRLELQANNPFSSWAWADPCVPDKAGWDQGAHAAGFVHKARHYGRVHGHHDVPGVVKELFDLLCILQSLWQTRDDKWIDDDDADARTKMEALAEVRHALMAAMVHQVQPWYTRTRPLPC
ncbi:hypothetical protein B0T22DRAFT_445703 [Podospora appendiculata]|uniref:Uncharacterized protein n=1 Tax=Podospora appendiculata TaxID=314037 RepID=A0AAE0WZ08_9PEZI|nr:hypothetical protein B0T22DRAFT_445703 [Podospora appendiculata]